MSQRAQRLFTIPFHVLYLIQDFLDISPIRSPSILLLLAALFHHVVEFLDPCLRSGLGLLSVLALTPNLILFGQLLSLLL